MYIKTSDGLSITRFRIKRPF